MVEVIVEVKQHAFGKYTAKTVLYYETLLQWISQMGVTFHEDLYSRVFSFTNSFTIAKNAKLRTDKVVSLTAAWGGVTQAPRHHALSFNYKSSSKKNLDHF